jgi:hypothetical protein
VTFVFNRSGDKYLDWAAKSALSSNLTADINEWTKGLPSRTELVARPPTSTAQFVGPLPMLIE